MKDAKSGFNWFLDRAGRIPLLTPEEEIMLGHKVQAMMRLYEEKPEGPYSSDEQRIIRSGKRAKDRMINGNLRLVVNIAKKYASRAISMDLQDLVQNGMFGLVRGVEKFDPERGYKASTYLFWWIRQAINRGLQDSDRIIRLPVHRQEKVIKARAYMTRQLALTGRTPTLAECAAHLGIKAEDLEVSLFMAQDVASLDAPASQNPDKSPILTLIPDEASLHRDDDLMMERDILADVLNTLEPDERDIICRYNGVTGYEKTTLRQLGEDYGVSREAIRQRHTRAMNKLRQRIRLHCQNQGRSLANDAGS